MLILLLILAPFGTGLIINRYMDEENRSLGVTYVAGFLTLLASFQLIAVPVVFMDPWGFETVVDIFTVVTTLFTGMGIIVTMHYWRRVGKIFHKQPRWMERSRLEQVQWILVFVLIGLQLFMAITHASFDGDDAFYVVQSVITDETNTLYRILPYTGGSTRLDMRHAMAVFPLWIAYIARMTDIHATIISHTVLPVFLIPLTYTIYYEIGKKLFKEKAEQLPSYMIFVCLLQIFGNVSVYNNATFLLMRTWQGKSMLANVVIPGIFMILLWLFEGEPEKRSQRGGMWFLLFMINIAAAMMSTASVFLNSFLIAVMAVVFSLQEKNVKIMLKMAICCIPCVVYALLYVLL
ncbi:MAG: hypothetical protein IKL49_03920 [Lachnospiraceae bacterium]|nr:hypothetical protein [Lachnospiraceae bacterium]